MNYFIQELQTESGVQRTAGIKARDDVDAIFSDLNIAKICIASQEEQRKNGNVLQKLYGHVFVLKTWKKQLKCLHRGDRLFIQFPVIGHSVFLSGLLQKYVKNGVEIILLIHDLELLRWAKRKDITVLKKIRLNIEEKSILNCCSKIIVHNVKMKGYLCKLGIPSEKVVSLGIFDYLIPNDSEQRIQNAERNRWDPIIIAGALVIHKAGYVYHLPDTSSFHLYGVGYTGSESDKIKYHGSFPPDELPYVMSGSFGLVWDGESADTCAGVYGEYLKINNPHKTSLYLASGIPVIIWKQAALAAFVEENHCGITVDSISDIKEKVSSITDEEYRNLQLRAAEVGERLRAGYYTKKAVETCIKESKM